ncbi:egf-like protein [Nannochloropsis oceanica]
MKITSTTFVAGCSLLLLCLTCTPETVRADQGMDMMDFEVPSGDDMMDAEASNEVFFLLSEKVAALTTAEATVLSLEEQLKASSEELADKAERLSASENEISELSEQVKELSSKLLKGETAATVAATKGEMAALTSELEQAQEEVRELSEKVKTLEATVAESEWQAEKAEDEKQILRKDLAEMTEGKRAAETSLDGAKDVAGLAFDRVKYLEGQVAKAKSDAVTARKTWEEELRLKDKEVVETKAKLQDAIDNKYSFRVLSEDLSAWSKKARAVMKIW